MNEMEKQTLNNSLEEVIKIFEQRTGKKVRTINLIRKDLPPFYYGQAIDLIDLDVVIRNATK